MSLRPYAPGAKALVLDANILVRAALGRRVLPIIESYAGRAHFLTAEVAFADARTHLPAILTKRGLAPNAIQLLEEILQGFRCSSPRSRKQPMPISRPRQGVVYRAGMRRIGRFWLSQLEWTALYGRRIKTSSAAGWLHGQPTA